MDPSPPQPLTPANAAALLRLLADPATAELVIARLAAKGPAALPELDALTQGAAPAVAAAIAEVRRRIDLHRRANRLRDRCARIDTLAELEDFAWRLVHWRDGAAPQKPGLELLDRAAALVRERLPPGAGPALQADILVSVLCLEQGFTGNVDNYYDPANSFLDRVLETRRGLPITLAAVFMFTGARAGIRVDGIGLPGHFLARVGETYLDPFNGGAAVSADALDTILRQVHEEARTELLAPLPFRLIAHRILRNLIVAHERLHDPAEAARAREALAWLE